MMVNEPLSILQRRVVEPTPSGELYHSLSFDIEDWFHIVGVPDLENRERWASFPSIVEQNSREIIELLDAFDVRATFFILGWVAEQYPSVVRMIADAGHEIGTHSFWHRKVYEMTPDDFFEDLIDSIDVLQQFEGVKVYGFRAPSFSITPGTEWAFDMIRKAGLEYDASLFPSRRAHGGYPCEPSPCFIRGQESEGIAELPMSIFPRGPLPFCFSGGGYFRLLPAAVIDYGMQQMEKLGRSAVVYLHPRDFAMDCPKVAMPVHRRFKCYVGRSSTARKLRRLLERYQFTTCRDVLRQHALLPAAKAAAEAQVEQDA